MVCFRYVFSPLGIFLGIRHTRPKKVVENKDLEKFYKKGTKITHKEVETIALKVNMTERQVERWLRIRKSIDRPTTLQKFCENGFRCTYYTYSFIFGLIILWNKSWLWNIKHCWYGYPHQVCRKCQLVLP